MISLITVIATSAWLFCSLISAQGTIVTQPQNLTTGIVHCASKPNLTVPIRYCLKMHFPNLYPDIGPCLDFLHKPDLKPLDPLQIAFQECRQFDSNCTRRKLDGCSVPTILTVGDPELEKFTDMFTPACNQHDVCYTTPGRAQSECDNDFDQNMKLVCSFYFWGTDLESCWEDAGTYSSAVRTFGEPSYLKNQQKCRLTTNTTTTITPVA